MITERERRKKGSFIDRLREEQPGVNRQIAGYKIIDINPAALQFHASYPTGVRYEAKKVAPNVAPPFPRFAVEFGCPPELEPRRYGRVAVIVTALDYEIETAPSEFRQHFTQTPKWTLTFVTITEMAGRIVQMPIAIHKYVYPTGELAARKDEWMFASEAMPETGLTASDLQTDTVSLGSFVMDWFIAPTLFAISLTHCKGVTIRAVPPLPHHSRKVRKRRKQLPTLEHHLIEIKDRTGRIADHAALETAIRKGLHIVRGHYATYTEEAPLFGRVTGAFWIPAHVRGSLSYGANTSEYQVAATAGLVEEQR